MPGCLPYLIYGQIVLWAVLVTGVQYGLGTLMVKYLAATDVASARRPNPKREQVVAMMKRVVFQTKLFWLLLTLLIVTVVPVLFWVGFFLIQWYDKGIYLYDPRQLTPGDVFVYTLKQE